MTRLCRLLVIASIAAGGLLAPATVHGAPGDDGGYVVEPGDYLFGIARRHGVSIGELLAANGLTLSSVIHPGQRLAVGSPAAGPSPSGRTYTVQPGDYLFGIARRHGVTIGQLLAANRLTLSSVIHPGQRLALGASATSPSSAAGQYTVRPGDSLIGIARRHGVSTASLLAANGLRLTSVIHPGQQLAVPAGASTPPTGPSTPPATPPATTASPPATASPPVTGSDGVEQIIRDVWPDALEERALAIAWRESRYHPDAQGQCCSGLFQIYYDVHKGWLAELGIDARGDLYDPRTNAEAAFALYQRAGGWGPWALPGE